MKDAVLKAVFARCGEPVAMLNDARGLIFDYAHGAYAISSREIGLLKSESEIPSLITARFSHPKPRKSFAGYAA